jgi:hypothetical protein
VTGFTAVPTGNLTALQQAVYVNPVAAGIDGAAIETYTSGVFTGQCAFLHLIAT